jgi:hypothetical protein
VYRCAGAKEQVAEHDDSSFFMRRTEVVCSWTGLRAQESRDWRPFSRASMNVRRFLLCILCLGLAAGCSKPISPDPMPDNSNPTQSENPSTGVGQGQQQVAYIVKNSGIRCIAPPCPTHLAVPVSNPGADAIQIHEIDFQDLNASDDQRMELMRKADETPEGLKVEAVLLNQPNAGPSGDATVLRVKKVLQ